MERLDFKITAPKLPALNVSSVEVPANGAALEAVQLEEPDWTAANAKRVTFDTIVANRVDMTRSVFRDSGWQDVRLVGGGASGADLTAASMRRLEFIDVRASGLVLAEADIRDVVFRNAKLDLANLRFCHLTRVLFDGCLLADADFAGAYLSHVSFVGCDLTQVDFSGAQLSHVDLRRSSVTNIKGIAGLKGAKLTTAQLMGLAPSLAAELGLEIVDS